MDSWELMTPWMVYDSGSSQYILTRQCGGWHGGSAQHEQLCSGQYREQNALLLLVVDQLPDTHRFPSRPCVPPQSSTNAASHEIKVRALLDPRVPPTFFYPKGAPPPLWEPGPLVATHHFHQMGKAG